MTSIYSVRKYISTDKDDCQRVSRSDFDYDQYINLPNHEIIVVEDEAGHLCGLGVIQIWNWNRTAMIIDISADIDSRYKGIGRTIIGGLVAVAREKGCVSLVDYVPVDAEFINFYLRVGFKIIGHHSRFFYHSARERKDAIIFGVDLE
jgi:ribosomal protein S18 acetylase RimI-like enzyme